MRFQLKVFLNKISSFITIQAQDSESQMITFGVFAIIAYPLFGFLNLHVLQPKVYENIYLRLIIGVLCLGLALKNYWPPKFKKFLPMYWYLTLLYSFPFFIIFMTLKNQASNEWLLNLLTVVFFTFLLVDWVSMLLLFFIGGFLAWFAYELSTHHAFIYTEKVISAKDFIGAYIVTIIFGVLFSRNKALSEKNKLQVMRSLSGNIAHEIRTPLAAIQAGIKGMSKYFPSLVEGYELAKQQELPVKYISRDHLAIIRDGFENVGLETNHASVIIEMLLTNIRHPELKVMDVEIFSVTKCIKYSLSHYPFSLSQKGKIKWYPDENLDFQIKGSQMLVVHIMYNLLRNALYFIDKAEKGDIFLWLESKTDMNILHFKDTGYGIAKKYLPYIFDRFFTKNTHQGTGIGLSFCKMVMENMNGYMICDSIEGEYTHFQLGFPKL